MRGPQTVTTDGLIGELRSQRLLAIVRGGDPASCVETCLVLARSGVRLIEVSLTTQDALEVLRDVAARIGGGVLLGAGTVLTDDDVAAAVDAGAQFVVTPALVPAIATATAARIPVLAGAFTPTEVVAALELGASAVKIFPAATLGPAYLTALRGPFPEQPLVAVGGIDVPGARAFLAAGADAVGVGGPLCGDAVDGGDLAGLRDRTREFLDVVS